VQTAPRAVTIYGKVVVKGENQPPVQGRGGRSCRITPSPSASVALPHRGRPPG
jgi:hypothetical protein